MFNLKISKTKNFSAEARFLKNNPNLAFWLILLVIFVYEFFVIKDALLLAASPQIQLPAAAKSGAVRINFADYNAAVKRIQNADSFQVTSWTVKDPFGTK